MLPPIKVFKLPSLQLTAFDRHIRLILLHILHLSASIVAVYKLIHSASAQLTKVVPFAQRERDYVQRLIHLMVLALEHIGIHTS